MYPSSVCSFFSPVYFSQAAVPSISGFEENVDSILCSGDQIVHLLYFVIGIQRELKSEQSKETQTGRTPPHIIILEA